MQTKLVGNVGVGALRALCAALLLLSACDCSGFGARDAFDGIALVEPAGAADQFERVLDFGPSRISVLHRRPILLRNDGITTADITRVELITDSGDFHLEGAQVLPTLQTGEEWALELRYLPGEVGPDEATIIIETSASQTPKYTIHVKARGSSSDIDVCTTGDGGAEVCLETQPDGRLTIDLGLVRPGQSSRKPLVVKNRGDAALKVTRVAPAGTTTYEFSVEPGEGPVDIAGGAKGDFEVVYQPLDGGRDEGTIEILSDHPSQPRLLVYLVGEGLAPKLCAAPVPLDFGEQEIGSHTELTLALESCGREPVTLTSATLDAAGTPFSIVTPPALPRELAPGEKVEVPVAYDPAAIGNHTARMMVAYTEAEARVRPVQVVGRAVGCSLTLVPGSLAFGNLSAGTGGRATRPVSLRNTGTGECVITQIAPPNAPFALDNAPALPLSIPAGTQQSIIVAFAPTTQGAAASQVVFTSNDPRGDVALPLSGNGVAPLPCDLHAVPNPLLFPGTGIGQSTSQNVLLRNFGTDSCYVSKADILPQGTAFSASVGGMFQSAEVPAGGQLQVPVKFSPQSNGTHSATVRFTYSEEEGPQLCLPPIRPCNDRTLDVALEGATLEPQVCVTPTELDFGAVAAGTTREQSFTITSCGQGPLQLRGLPLKAGSSAEFATVPPRLPQSLAPGASIQVRVVYAPRTNGADFGAVEVLTNDPNSPVTDVRLRANATSVCDRQIVCGQDRLSFPTMEIGRASSMSVVCQNPGTQDATLSQVRFASGTSGEFKAVAGRLPVTVPAGGTVRVEVTYVPQDGGVDTGSLELVNDGCEPTTVALEAAGKLPNYPVCPPQQVFQPVEKWSWNGGTVQPDSKNVAMSPVVLNLTDDNGDGRIDESDIPDVIFTSCRAGQCCERCMGSMEIKDQDFSGRGMLRAVHGQNGRDLWAVTDASLMLTATSQIAAGDLDGDNLPEIVAVKHHFQTGSGGPTIGGVTFDGLYNKYKTGHLLVFDHTGKLKFQTDAFTGDPECGEQNSAPTLADLDNDGLVEIIFERSVFAYNGRKLFDLPVSGNDGHGSVPSVSDLDGDGKLEIIVGRHVFRADGTLWWSAPASGGLGGNSSVAGNGPTMVLDVDGDGSPEIVLRPAANKFVVYDAKTGTKKYGPFEWTLPESQNDQGSQSDGICGAPMSAADIDGDGRPELIIPSGDRLMAWRATGQMLWSQPISDYGGQCGASGSAAFDFEGDGKFEAVYHDTRHMYVFRGDGTKIYEAPRNSSTLFETPVIADVDNDGHADLVMTNENGMADLGQQVGVKVLSNVGNTWAATRRVWNQHAYHVSDINENGSIPRVEMPHWKTTNSWRANTSLCKPQ